MDDSESSPTPAIPCWRETLADLLEAAAVAPTAPSPAPDGFWAQLATVRAKAPSAHPVLKGRPAVRTVNLRRLRGGAAARDPAVPTNVLLHFITDTRSDKAEDCVRAGAELLLFFPKSMCQLRCSGILHLMKKSDVLPVDTEGNGKAWKYVESVWRGLNHKERRYFAWPSPGKPRTCTVGSMSDVAHFDLEPPAVDECPSIFAVAVLDVDYVECLNLAAFPPIRTQHTREDSKEWTSVEVNP